MSKDHTHFMSSKSELNFLSQFERKIDDYQRSYINRKRESMASIFDTETKLYIALAAFGSCRRGEICAIKYADLLPDGVYIHADIVQNDKNEWVYKEMPKTSESVRKVKLPDSVLALFGNGEADEFVIKRTPLAVSHKYERLRHNLGLDHIRFHDLRHYFASIAAVLDIPQNYIADFGGWRKDSPVLREVYQNKIIPIAEQYSEKLNSHFRKLID